MNTVLVDMDGVLVDFELGVRRFVQANIHSLSQLPPQFNSHNFAASYEAHLLHLGHDSKWADTCKKALIRQYHSPGFFLNLPPISGAFEGWDQLKSLGFHPVVCSKPVKSATCQHEKRQWIRQYLGSKVADEAYIIQDKGLAHGAVLIDDRPNLTTYALQRKETLPKWKHCLYIHDYNKKWSNIEDNEHNFIMKNWNDLEWLSNL